MKPTDKELHFLTLAYNAFYDLYDEALSESFWDQDAYHRLSKVRDAYSIYSELMEYEPLKEVLLMHEKMRPPSESMIAQRFFPFLRNLLLHFPLFTSWNEIWFDRKLVNWSKPGRSIDKFLQGHKGEPPIKYRMWNSQKKEFSYLTIRLPNVYDEDTKIFLKDILSEKDGIIFSFSLMKTLLDTQVEK